MWPNEGCLFFSRNVVESHIPILVTHVEKLDKLVQERSPFWDLQIQIYHNKILHKVMDWSNTGRHVTCTNFYFIRISVNISRFVTFAYPVFSAWLREKQPPKYFFFKEKKVLLSVPAPRLHKARHGCHLLHNHVNLSTGVAQSCPPEYCQTRRLLQAVNYSIRERFTFLLETFLFRVLNTKVGKCVQCYFISLFFPKGIRVRFFLSH